MQGVFRFARHVAFIALVARALMPTGWMPDAQAGLTICSLGIIHHDGAPANSGHDQHDAQHEDCPFAAAAHMAAAPDAPLLALPAFHAFAAATDRATAVAIAAQFTPQSPRGPPRNA
jgi:hypothetical protein